MYVYYIITVLSLFLFLHGFFPTSNSTTNIKYAPPTRINNYTFNPQLYSDIDKTVLIVIDALRLDFVNPQYMPLTSNITKNNGCFSTVTVETPTVTLPRIKALTAGNVPQFIDLVLNLASTEILHDSIIHSLYNKGKKIVFYGDDTWLKLFPNFFARYEGTSSFFVRDFKEVDDNVTRNVNIELGNNDWDMMILHYLGLDHIGHVYGPFSSHIPDKLKEMDEIISNIYLNMTNKKFMLIVTGDHGMRDSGGHGGASYFETHVPFLVIGPQCDNGSLHQIDIPTNLAVLLGVDIPSTCIGEIRPNLLHNVSLEKYLFTLRYNNLQLLSKTDICNDHFLLATKLHEMYLTNFEEINAFQAIEIYRNCSNMISNYLIKSSVQQNMYSLIISIHTMINVLVFYVTNILVSGAKMHLKLTECLIYLLIILAQYFVSIVIFSIVYIIVLIICLVMNLVSFAGITSNFQSFKGLLRLMVLVAVIHPFTFLSSSFVEEEHQFWYFFNIAFVIWTILVKIRKLRDLVIFLGILTVLRFLRTINSTGDKWASYPDLSDWLLENRNYHYLQLFFVFGLSINFLICMLINSKTLPVNLLNFIIFVLIFILKNMEYGNAFFGQLIWFLILCHLLLFRESKIVTWILISSLLLKPYNLLLVSYCVSISILVSKIYHSTTVITLFHFWLANMLHFTQGHSNSLASVDVSVGYIGLSEYQPLLVLVQVLFHTYSLSVLSHFLLFRSKINVNKAWMILFTNRLYVTIVTCVITVGFRHHLFIWSVFAPKLFIESIHLVFLFVEYSVYLCWKHFRLDLNECKALYKKCISPG